MRKISVLEQHTTWVRKEYEIEDSVFNDIVGSEDDFGIEFYEKMMDMEEGVKLVSDNVVDGDFEIGEVCLIEDDADETEDEDEVDYYAEYSKAIKQKLNTFDIVDHLVGTRRLLGKVMVDLGFTEEDIDLVVLDEHIHICGKCFTWVETRNIDENGICHKCKR